MKKIIVTGNVGKDPETRYAPSGEAFVTFSLAVASGTKANPRTDWLEITCNGRTAEVVQNYVRKGTKLLIEGTPNAAAYINKEGKPVATLRVSASTIEFIGSKEKSDNEAHDGSYGDEGTSEHESQPTQPQSTKSGGGFNAPGPMLDPDIPF